MPRISDFNSISASSLAAGDDLVVVDVSDTSMAPSGTNKQVTLAEFITFASSRPYSSSAVALATRVAGDSFDRLQITPTGAIRRGTGATSPYTPGLTSSAIALMVRSGTSTYFRVGATGASTGTASVDSGRASFQCFFTPINCTLTEVGVEVVTGGSAGANMQIGLYSDDIDSGRPSSLITDFGTVATTASGTVATITGLSVPISANLLYWLAFLPLGSPTTAPVIRVTTGVNAFGTIGLVAYTPGGPQTFGGFTTLPASAIGNTSDGPSGSPTQGIVRLSA